MIDRPVTDTAERFDLGAPLPHGHVVLEASAGTGKTYAIAGLVARFVAEGTELAQLLVVTFTRAAAAELRDRVRTRLVATLGHLEAAVAGSAPVSDDDALRAVADAPAGELEARRQRVVAALADFDAATITTIHGFCQQVLTSLGLLTDVAPDAEVSDDTSDLLEDVVDDVLVGRFVAGEEAVVSRQALLDLAATVAGNPDAQVVPDPDAVAGEARLRAELVAEVAQRYARRKRRAGVLGYDDLLTRLRDALADPDQGAAAAATLRRRYRVALVDEFQDTDPVQWDILRRAFGENGDDATLVMIGDPKQAIYAFRGADVYAYLDAVAAASTRATLDTNWRSDAPLIAAYDVLFDGVTFGHDGIAYRSVRAAPEHDRPRLALGDGSAPTPLRVRCLRRDHGLRDSQGDIGADVARNRIAADVTVETVRLLDAGAGIVERDRDGAASEPRPFGAGDLAVLVRTNAEANLVQRCLTEAGVPAIINGVGSVFLTPAAAEWRRLLEALERPTSVGRVRAAALTSFLGWRPAALAEAGDDDLVPVHDRLHRWAEILRDHGVASLKRTITVTEELSARVLARPDGERFLTDLDHAGELLHAAATTDQLGPSALAAWLRARIAEASDEQVPPDERARRLESDAAAVQILTIHRSKGLEFPVVFCPFLSSGGRRWLPIPVFHDPVTGRRTVDVGGGPVRSPNWDRFPDHQDRAMTEQRGEDLRLLYVALTRARHHAVVWWAPVRNSADSALGRVLFGRRSEDGRDTTGRAPITNDDRLGDRLEDELVAPAGGHISVGTVPPEPEQVRWAPPTGPAPDLDAAVLGRDIDQRWRRTSYSALTARSYDPASTEGGLVGSEPGDAVTDDERLDATELVRGADPADAAPTLDEAELRGVELPLGEVAGGAAFGTLVHAILEHTDFTADDLATELHVRTLEQLGRVSFDLDVDTLVEGLAAAIRTPLGPLGGGLPLAEVGEDDRIDELGFELPLAGGDTAGRTGEHRDGAVTVAAIGALLRDHLRPPDPLAAYADRLTDPAFDERVRGYLTGSIDLVLRIRDGATPRFLVVDHKTNRLGSWDEPLTAWDYRPAALADAMMHGHYPLQALLYQVALHRYLRWRQPDYDPATHLGGVLYLFLRGMTGTDRGGVGTSRCGVFGWTPPIELVVALSDLLHEGTS